MNIKDFARVRLTPPLASGGRALLGRPFIFYLGAVMVTYMSWWSGLTKLWDHDFWNMQGQAAFVEKLWAQEHISVVGGLIVAAIVADLRSRRAK